MNHFVVRVCATRIDRHGIEQSSITDAYVPVEAADEDEACKRAVLWHGDNGVAVETDDLFWKCDDRARGLSFKATKCLSVTSDELNTFLCLTQGLSTATVIGRSATN